MRVLLVGLVLWVAACSPDSRLSESLRTASPTATATPDWTLTPWPSAVVPTRDLRSTPTATLLPTSELPPTPIVLRSPVDGAVLHSALPTFEYEEIPNAQGYEIIVYDAAGEWIVTWGQITSGVLPQDYYPTPAPLPDGRYAWTVCARRYSSGRSQCSDDRWTFTIQSNP